MKSSQYRIIAENRRGRHDYFIESTLEAGIVLGGSEVKSLRAGRISLNESYAGEMQGEIFLFNVHIPEYLEANRFNHEPRRPRKILVKKRECNKLLGSIQRKGMTLIALSCYFNDHGFVKIKLGLASGKRQVDKRESETTRLAARQSSNFER